MCPLIPFIVIVQDNRGVSSFTSAKPRKTRLFAHQLAVDLISLIQEHSGQIS